MPTVSLYGARKVDATLIPGVRKSAAETPDSEGAGLDLANARRDTEAASLGAEGATIATNALGEQQKAAAQADQVATLDAHNQLLGAKTGLLWDPTTGALNVKGKAAVGNVDPVLGQFDDAADTIADGLTTDKQKLAFQKIRDDERNGLNLDLERHASGQLQEYDAQTVNAFSDNKQNEAAANAQDPGRVGQALAEGVDALKAAAPRQGWSAAVLQQKVDNFQTATLTGVIGRLLDNGQTASAKAYFDETKSLIKGDALGAIEKALQVGQAKSTGIQEADTIIGKGGTLAEQLEQAKQFPDAVRLVVEQRIEHANGLKVQADRATTETLLTQSYDALTKSSGDLTQIPPTVQATLAQHMPALMSYAEKLSKGEKPETDWPTYTKLMMQASSADPAMRKAFSTANLQSYIGKLAPAEYKQVIEIQSAQRNGDFKAAEAQVSDFREHHEQISGSLFSYTHTDPHDFSPAQKESAVDLERMVNQGIAALEAKPGAKKATYQDVQGIIDKILTPTTAASPGSWWALNPFSSTHWKDIPESGVMDKTLLDITPATRAVLEQGLRNSGNAVNDVTVLNAYRNMLVRTKKK